MSFLDLTVPITVYVVHHARSILDSGKRHPCWFPGAWFTGVDGVDSLFTDALAIKDKIIDVSIVLDEHIIEISVSPFYIYWFDLYVLQCELESLVL